MRERLLQRGLFPARTRVAVHLHSSVVVALCIVAASGCAVIPEQHSVRSVKMRPTELQEYYGYKPITALPVSKRVRDQGKYWVRRVELTPPSATRSTDASARSSPIQLVWFEPKTPSPAPLILISPISGSNTMFVDGFAQSFARSGYHAAIVKRLPLRLDPNGPITQVEDYLREAIVRNRQALDWLLARPNVDANRVASFGISYGAIINAATAGVDGRLRVNVFALAGAPIANVVETSAERSLHRFWTRLRGTHHLTDQQLADALRETVRSDPIQVAPYVDSADVLMVIALFDRSVGTANSLQLWRALGQPKTVFIPFGHYTAILAMPNLRHAVNQFFHEKLDISPQRGNGGYIYRRP